MASEDGSGEEDKKVADMQVDNPEIQAQKEAEPNPNEEDSVMEDKEEQEKENDVEKAKESVENEEKETDKAEEEDEKEEEEDEKEEEEEKVIKKGSQVKTPVSKNPKPEMREATIERPSRERKTVERYTEVSVARGSGTKPFSIQKGKGTRLKDIPNVAFKLSKVKPDDNLQQLHYILFGKRTKVHTLKKNIRLFSGFVWAENEEKQRTKIKERIDKCVKEKLQYVCEILNIPFNKTSTKKEDLSAKLLEFLESPHITTEELLADKEVKGKRQRKAKSSKSPSSVDEASGASSKKQKLESESEKKRKRPSKNAEEDDEGEHPESKDASQDNDNDSNSDTVSKEESEQENKSEEEEENEKVTPKTQSINKRSKNVDKSKSVKKTTPTKSSKETPKLTKKSSMSSAKEKAEKADIIAASGSSRKSKVPSAKKQKSEKEHEKDQALSAKEKTPSKRKSSTKALAKDQGNGTPSKKAKPEPSKEEMHAVVAEILKKVDFNTATLSDILKELGSHFDIDLMHRKVEVKSIITDVINNMTDEDDDGEEGSGEEGEGDGEDDNNA